MAAKDTIMDPVVVCDTASSSSADRASPTSADREFATSSSAASSSSAAQSPSKDPNDPETVKVTEDEFLEAAKLLGPFPVVHHKDGSIEVTIHDPKAKVKKEKKRTVPPKATCPPAKRWKPAVRVRKEDEELAITDTFCDHELWKGKIKAPAQLPSKLNVLETFAGAGGLHMEGKGTFGKIAVEMQTVTAIEIVDDPCLTYRHNHPNTNVVHIGVSRFLATARRLQNLKTSAPPAGAVDKVKIVDMRINPQLATCWRGIDAAHVTSTTDKQFGDEVTHKEVTGVKALDWLEWKVRDGKDEDWCMDDAALAPAAHQYLNSKDFGMHKFPLPGDIHVVTGGPPCQGWSGYNTQRPVSEAVEELMSHPENRLIGRFMEVCWFYRPLYVLMEEVPDVASKGNVVEFIRGGYKSKGYECTFERRLRTGLFGCPQTRDRLIVLAALESLPLPSMPQPIHSDIMSKAYPEDETDVKMAFMTSTSAYPIGMWAGRKSNTELMRSLVIGDSLSTDLPKDGKEFGSHAGNRSHEAVEASACTVAHTCAPPTPYIAYLRQDCPNKVHNHVYYALGKTDHLRCQLVPYEFEACWREMGGFKATLKNPMMMELDDDAWAEMGPRWIRKIPQFMRADGKAPGRATGKEDTIPQLKKPWKLQSHRFPAVPYWCLTMKHGADTGCYGRLSYAEPHPTVHSYHKPHWHPSLVPFAPRVMTVREKARIQGFPDNFVFQGTVEKQYKQIANAVSPQLAKFLCRSIIEAHLQAVSGKATVSNVTFSKELQTFRDFMLTFDESSLPKAKRHMPAKVNPPKLVPMQYEEFIIEYNTEYRLDHSIRNAGQTPFEVAEKCEDKHMWHIEKVLAVRWMEDPEEKNSCYMEILALYHGFTVPEWIPLCPAQQRLIAWKKFHLAHKAQVDKLMATPKRFKDPDSGVAASGYSDYLTTENGEGRLKNNGYNDPDLVKAQKQFDQWKQRYQQEKNSGLIKATNTTTKYDRK
uniref:DNA (cytosine-5-)-methyltransferase n=1 Tax=Eutreptiella gymnastica TaxID=73025 RepID=A0A7S4GPC2_9EUGL